MILFMTSLKKTIYAIIFLIFSTSAFSQTISSGNINFNCTVDVALNGGYTHSQSFVLNGETFLFSHNSNTGQTEIWNLKSGGGPKYSAKWSSGWTNIDFYTFEGEVYFFHQKGASGTAKIIKLNYNSVMNNKLGSTVYEGKWSSGWTSTKFFVHNNIAYFLHYKKETGLIRLNAATKGGSVGKRVYEGKWSKGYTSFSFTENAGSIYLIAQQNSTGKAVISRINTDKMEMAVKAGLISPNLGEEVYRKNWSTGWSDLVFFNLNKEAYLFHYKNKEGTARIDKLNADGTLGKKVYDKKWSTGWSSFDIIYFDGKPNLFHQKTKTGQTKICELKF